MATKQSLQHCLIAVETLESDRASFEQCLAQMAWGEVKQLSRTSITLRTSIATLHAGLLMKDTPNDGVLDLALIGLMHAPLGSRWLNPEEIFLKASSSFR